MRLAKHVKIISSHLENLEDLKRQFGNLLEYIENLITEGQSWINEKESSKSFSEISHFLTSETSNCILKCLSIAYENDESSLVGSKSEKANSASLAQVVSHNSVSCFKDDTDYKYIKIKLDENDTLVTSYSTQLHDMKETIKHYKKQSEIVSSKCEEKYKKTEEKFEEIIKELHAASDFMSHLQSQSEMMSNMKTENEKILESRIRKLVELEERLKPIIAIQDSEVKLQSVIDEIEKKVCNLTGSVQLLKQDFEKKNSMAKISFSVTLIQDTEFALGSLIKYNKILTNIGDSYNISSGIFTCPLDGLYVFHVCSMAQLNKFVNMDLYKNSEYLITIYAFIASAYASCGSSVNLHLKKNDQIFLKAKEDCVLYGLPDDTINTFSGFLLFAD